MSASPRLHETRPTVLHGLLEIARRRVMPSGSGSDLWWLLEQRQDPLVWWQTVEHDLRPYAHAVIGGVAANIYMPARHTADIDFALAASQASSIARHLTIARGWRDLGRLSLRRPFAGRAYVAPGRHPVDLIFLPPPISQGLLTAAARNRIADMPTATLPYLVLLKLIAGRAVDLGDLSRMLGHQPSARLAAVRRLIRIHAPSDLDDLEQIINHGRAEYGRRRNRRMTASAEDIRA